VRGNNYCMREGVRHTMIEINKIIQGDTLEVLKTMPDESIDSIITSPPYWALRDYGLNRFDFCATQTY